MDHKEPQNIFQLTLLYCYKTVVKAQSKEDGLKGHALWGNFPPWVHPKKHLLRAKSFVCIAFFLE